MVLTTSTLAACAEFTEPVDPMLPLHATGERSQGLCPSSLRSRTFGAPDAKAPLERRIPIGDTLRVQRLSQTSTPSTSTAGPKWRIGDSTLARIEGELLIPIAPGRTRLTASVAGQMLCMGLTTVFAGATLSAVSVDSLPVPMSIDAGARVNATLRFSNGLSVVVAEAVTWTALDPQVATIAPDAFITARQAGVARMVARVGSFADTLSVHISATPFETVTARPAESFVESIGVNIHLSYLDRVYGSGFRSIIVPRLRELRVRHLRDGGTTLPNEDWMREIYGRWQETADATGARFTIIMSPRRTANGPGSNYADMSHVGELVGRIGIHNIAAWEGLNEHDLSGRANFAAEVRASQQALYTYVKNNPNLAAQHQVLGPSIAFTNAAPQVGDLSAFMDVGVIHPYDGGRRPATNLAAHRAGIRSITGTRALIATELGFHTASASTNPWHWAVSEAVQAKYTLRQFLEAYNAGIQRSFVYELIDEGTDPSDMELQFGLLRNDGSRKPAFDGLRNLIALLDDRGGLNASVGSLRMQVSGDTSGVRRLLVEKVDGRRYLVLWQDVTSYDEQRRQDLSPAPKTLRIAFDSPQRHVNVYVPLDGIGAVAMHQNVRTVTLAVPDHPIVLELRD